ncbi:MAG: hypothetical protein ACK4IX_03705 [Candidatus Sericytochromatia bacterium]
MFDFKELNQAKTKTEDISKNRIYNFEQLYNSALDDITQFKISKNKILIQSATEKLVKANSLKRSDPRPYIKLAYISYVFDNNALASKYLREAKLLTTNNQDIDKLQNLISKNR